MIKPGRVAIVTGAARGIGAATAQILSQAGAYVALCDIDGPETEAVTQSIRDSGGEASTFVCDVSQVAAVEQLVKDVVSKYGSVDILINNAGICPRVPVEEMTEALFDRMMNINLKPVFFLTRAAAEAMKPQKWGRVVNISSTGGRIGGVHNATVYSATKGGILAITKSLARHYAPYNILVNCIAPGAVNTRMFSSVAPEALDDYVQTVPLRRMADPEEIANSIVHLCAEETTWVTGATLDVNGGVIMV